MANSFTMVKAKEGLAHHNFCFKGLPRYGEVISCDVEMQILGVVSEQVNDGLLECIVIILKEIRTLSSLQLASRQSWMSPAP